VTPGAATTSAAPAATPAAVPTPAPVVPTPTPAVATPAPAPAATPAAATDAPAVATPATEGQVSDPSLVIGEQYESTVQEMMSMGFPRTQIIAAMRASFNNPDRAMEYLLSVTIIFLIVTYNIQFVH
jgi:UV excision repair protein RAD23